MIKVIDNAKLKFLFVFVIVSIALSALTVGTHLDFVAALRVFYGGLLSFRLQGKAGFVVLCMLVQYVNADIIVFYLKNIIYLRIRYSKVNHIIYSVLGKVCALNLIFAGIALISTTGGLIFARELTASGFAEIMGITCRGFLVVAFFSLLQILLSLHMSQVNSFACLTLIALAVSFFGETPMASFALMPRELQGGSLFINIAVSVLIVAGLVAIAIADYRRCKKYA